MANRIFVVLLAAAIAATTSCGADAATMQVVVNTTHSVSDTVANFLSFTLDSSLLCKDIPQMLSSPDIVQLAKNLGPAYLRIGGTEGDNTVFGNGTATTAMSAPSPPPPVCHVTGPNWQLLHTFAKQVGWEVVYGLNALLRNADGSWNDTNARELFQYTLDNQLTMGGWELGNEPDLYPTGQFQTTVTPKQMADAFATLVSAVKDVFGDEAANMKIFGPDVATLSRNWYPEFIETVTPNVLSVVTIHFYYLNSNTAVLQDYLNATVLDKLGSMIEGAMNPIRAHLPNTRLWLGETSSSYDGGKKGVSDTYAVTPMWVDKLGLSARLGVQGIMRQDYFGGNYGLLSPEHLPTPDYWISVIFKRIAGTRILSVHDDMVPHRTVRAYARCAAAGGGAVLVMLANLNDYNVTLTFPGLTAGTRDQYLFTEGIPGNVTSATIQMNGVVLQAVADGSLPAMSPAQVDAADSLIMPRYATAFLVFHDAQSSVCV